MTNLEICSHFVAIRGYVVIGHDGPPLSIGDTIDRFNDGVEDTDYPLRVIAETDHADNCAQSKLWPKEDSHSRYPPSRPNKYYYRVVACD